MYKLIVYVPEQSVEVVKEAIFKTGAGKIGNYDKCAWQVLGTGQFRALNGANPTIGTVNALENVPEYRVEILCLEDNILNAIKAMLSSHPYEEPAYEVVSIYNYGSLQSRLK